MVVGREFGEFGSDVDHVDCGRVAQRKQKAGSIIATLDCLRCSLWRPPAGMKFSRAAEVFQRGLGGVAGVASSSAQFASTLATPQCVFARPWSPADPRGEGYLATEEIPAK